ncbi:hypothetical protein FEM48_Zijuj01G0165300 [Ziziphus jujuba var. spinosa]|uniref:Uncharacterized protein n=1 Tax=Ziziphus jujuba var. spinosa TaxID=714518 RepID=A0A978U8Q9_ZIZJJ|nr:hypothetical protein FEM48_ZijujUnG0078100 [Ziziphus jujuba var. spinosa]KAH7546105.1 hypothetical protein FEM48_Zijuj01G0165300 [Ziziphus jujuba var. spinosa]
MWARTWVVEYIDSIIEGRNNVIALIDMLKMWFLLLDGDVKGYVKIHDVVLSLLRENVVFFLKTWHSTKLYSQSNGRTKDIEISIHHWSAMETNDTWFAWFLHA